MNSSSPPEMSRSASDLSSLSSRSEPSELPVKGVEGPTLPTKEDVKSNHPAVDMFTAHFMGAEEVPAIPVASTSKAEATAIPNLPQILLPTPIEEATPAVPQMNDKEYLDAIFGRPFVEEEALEMSDGEESESEYYAPSPDGIRRRKKIPGGRLRPSYYYPSSDAKVNGARGIPVFEPTIEEFSDFYNFINKVDKYGMRAGLVKVVPPKEWHDKLPSVDAKLRNTRIKDPISELMHGSSGLYRQTNITKTRMWNAKQWQELAFSERYAPPDFFNKEKGKEKEEETPAPKKRQPRRKKPVKQAEATPEPVGASEVKSAADETEIKPTPMETEPEPAMDAIHGLAMLAQPNEESLAAITESQEAHSEAATIDDKPKVRKLTGFARTEITDEEWSSFDWKKMMHDAKPEDFTVEACREIERRYWRTLTFGEPPMYGADMQGSLFTADTTEWNVANLDDLLRKLRPNQRIPGVNTPYLYFGMWRATFAWHVEDADLYSINYVHFGAPKFWYSVPQDESERFERVMTSWFAQDRQRCPEFLRHKSFLASPSKLENQGIRLNRVVQLPGEYILTYPRGYHSGFNVGFNCAESINFATAKWLEIGRKARACTCVEDSVRINIDNWLQDALTDATELRQNPTKRQKRVREYDGLGEAAKRQKIWSAEDAQKQADKDAKIARKLEKQRIEQAAVAAALARSSQFVCVLCPDTTRKSLVKLAPPRNPNAKADARRRAGFAHKICVMFCPATWIAPDAQTGEELVHGFENIEKARWDLKCQLCPEKHGVKVQCTKAAKCFRANHVTCAVKEDSGAIIDVVVGEGTQQVSLIDSAREEGGSIFDIFDLPPPVDDADADAEGDEDTEMQPPLSPVQPTPAAAEPSNTIPPPAAEDATSGIKLVVCCRQHNVEWMKKQAKSKSSALAVKIAAIPIGGSIRIKTAGGIFETKLIANLPERESVQVEFGDSIGRISLYKYSAVTWKEVVVRPPITVARPTKMDDFVYDHIPSQQRVRSVVTKERQPVQRPIVAPQHAQPVLQYQSPIFAHPMVHPSAYQQHPMPSVFQPATFPTAYAGYAPPMAQHPAPMGYGQPYVPMAGHLAHFSQYQCEVFVDEKIVESC